MVQRDGTAGQGWAVRERGPGGGHSGTEIRTGTSFREGKEPTPGNTGTENGVEPGLWGNGGSGPGAGTRDNQARGYNRNRIE